MQLSVELRLKLLSSGLFNYLFWCRRHSSGNWADTIYTCMHFVWILFGMLIIFPKWDDLYFPIQKLNRSSHHSRNRDAGWKVRRLMVTELSCLGSTLKDIICYKLRKLSARNQDSLEAKLSFHLYSLTFRLCLSYLSLGT
jgi:hypothetical protein